MGDIAFNIFKDVNLNKVVTLDIDKNIDVNVNNPDQLATAEADAEAFGPFALAEVDAYTVVTVDSAFAYAESTSALDLFTATPPPVGANIEGTPDDNIITPDTISGGVTGGNPGPGEDTIRGSTGNDTIDGGGGIDTADYSALGQAITLERAGIINKGSAGTDQILNIETIIGAVGEENAIDGSTATSGVTSFDIDLSAETLTVRDIPVLGDQTFTVQNFVNVIGTSNGDSIVGDDNDNVLTGSEGDDNLDGGGGNDTVDYSALGQAITLERAGIINKGSAGTDQILNIETIIGAVGEENAIDGSTATSGVTSFDIDLSAETLTVRDIPVLGDQTFTVQNFVNVTGTSNGDNIVGDGNNNVLVGGAGADELTGVDLGSATPGSGEVDTLIGGGDADTIFLGDGTNVFYSFDGNNDFADIQDFQSGIDIIKLTGGINDYSFNGSNTEIFLDSSNDLIATFTNGAFDPNVDFDFTFL